MNSMVSAVRPEAVLGPTWGVQDGLTGWVSDYRNDLPVADCWARGLRHVTHSIETQDRVFRMAEQLAGRGVARADLFLKLEEADRSVALSNAPEAAAAAGHRAITALFPLDEASILICADLGPSDLRPFGFDPIPFDGHDPAAYAWVMFEMTLRARAESERLAAHTCRPLDVPTTLGLAAL